MTFGWGIPEITLLHVHVYGCEWTGRSLWWGNLYVMNIKIQICVWVWVNWKVTVLRKSLCNEYKNTDTCMGVSELEGHCDEEIFM